MLKTKNILHISPDFNYSCGVSKYVFSLLRNFSRSESYRLFFITNGGDALERIRNININPTIINFSRGLKNVFKFYPNLRYLRKFCIQNDIEIIHTHHRYPEYLAYQVSKKTDIKTITTVHSLVKGKNSISFKSDKIIAVSNSVKQLLSDNYKISSQKITVLHNYLEIPDFREQGTNLNIKSALDIPENEKLILYLGRITKDKGVDILIDAFKLLRQADKKVFLLIVGQIYDNSLIPLFKNLPFGIKYLGVVKDPFPYYAAADLVVLPSGADSFPYVMLEAGIMRKPFLGTRIKTVFFS